MTNFIMPADMFCAIAEFLIEDIIYLFLKSRRSNYSLHIILYSNDPEVNILLMRRRDFCATDEASCRPLRTFSLN